jgi:tetratricopeptide (TPR) repeat protein
MPYDLNEQSAGSDPLENSSSADRAICFVISPGFDANDSCVSKVEQARRQYPKAYFIFILVDVSTSECIRSDDFILSKEGFGGVRRIDIIRIAGKIDELGRNLSYPPASIKERRKISFSPNPFNESIGQDKLHVLRHQVIKDLFNILRSHRVVAISGMPSSGRSVLAVDLMKNISLCEPNPECWPLTVVISRVCDGSVPDLSRLCSFVFDALGPPAASGEEDMAMALARLLDDCETWLVLDEFETAMSIDQQCKDPDMARFLRIANNTLEKGRVIFTSSSPGVNIGNGQSCISFSVPEWTSGELKQLAKNMAETLNVLPPPARHFRKLLALSSGNPFSMIVAMKSWYKTGVVPDELDPNLKPYEKIGPFVQAAGSAGRAILHILNLVTTFSAGLSLIRRTIKQLNRLSIDFELPPKINVDAEIASLRRMELVQVRQDKDGEFCYRLPGMVSDCLKHQYAMEPDHRHGIAKVLAECILEEEGDFESCLELFGPVIHDGKHWNWINVSKEEVARAVRAADVLISAGDHSYAADLLMGEQNEILKTFNRIAPASIRSTFFDRFRIATKKDPIGYHEATRGLALALTDMADFRSAINLLRDVIEVLDDTDGQISQDDLNQYKAKNFDLMAYCQRQLGPSENSVRTYHRALNLLSQNEYEDERCKLLRGLGNSLVVQGDYQQAKKYFNKSKIVAQQLPIHRRVFNEGRINCDLSILETLNGDLETAKRTCSNGMNAMKKCGDVWNERIAYMNLTGIELALVYDVETATDRLRTLIEQFIHLENRLALRVAREHLEALKLAPERAKTIKKWRYLELT